MVAVVVAILAGLFGAVALAGPATRDKLGLGTRRRRRTRRSRSRRSARCRRARRTPNAAGLVRALNGPTADPALGNLSGVVVDPAAQRGVPPLWQRERERSRMVPGSVTKLLTAAAALLTLNPTDRLATRVVAGPEPDSVVLVGGGDPTLTALPAGRNSVYPDPARLDDAGRRGAQGASTVRSRRSTRTRACGPGPSWRPAGARVTCSPATSRRSTSLMLDGGRTDPTVQDGQPRIDRPGAGRPGRRWPRRSARTR